MNTNDPTITVQLQEDGTLFISMPTCHEVKRVFVYDRESIFGKFFYEDDEDELRWECWIDEIEKVNPPSPEK